jgi:hypothetical protein
MSKEIWLPDSTTHVTTDPNGYIRIWDNIIMTKKTLQNKTVGFKQEEKGK